MDDLNGASGAASAERFIQTDFDIFLSTFRVEHIQTGPVTSLSVRGKKYRVYCNSGLFISWVKVILLIVIIKV